jgi:hypothetical protein
LYYNLAARVELSASPGGRAASRFAALKVRFFEAKLGE